MHVDELVGQLQACREEELEPHLEALTRLIEQVRQHAARQRMVDLALAAAATHRDEPAMDEDAIRAYLGRDRDGC